MKKITRSLPTLMMAVAVSIAVGCNSGATDESTGDSADNSMGANTDVGGDSAGVTNTMPTNDANAVMTDTGFISKNIVDNMTEIQLSKLGKDQASNAEIKKLATQMIADHTQMLSDLKTLAGKKSATAPPATLADTSMLSSMRSATGTDFDNSWSAHMLTMHEAKIRELESALSQTQDADLKALINKGLPKIKAHRDRLTSISTGNQGAQ